MNARPYTPETLAALWGCSPNHIRNLIHRRELRAFRLGRRLFRIPPDAVEEYEKCQEITVSAGSTESSSSLGGATMGSDGVIVLTHSRERKPREPRST